jgi:hypothetical protein
MNEHNTRQEQAERSSPLSSERGATTISDAVVSKVAGIAALEVEGIEMGGATARTVGGFLDSWTDSWTGSGGHLTCQLAFSHTKTNTSLPRAESLSEHHAKKRVVIPLTERPATNLSHVSPTPSSGR